MLSRREFLRGAAGVLALQHLPQETGEPQFAYVGCGDGSLRVFSVRGERWRQIQSLPSRAPACVLLSPPQQMLYVANEVEEHQGMPRGTVESFHIHPADGRLTLSGRTALSLSATRPRHMAISANGEMLAVAAHGGGIYNLIAVTADGTLGQVTSIFKEAGCGPHALQASAHPHTLFFDAGHLLSSDFGRDRLSVFAFENGRLRRRMQRFTGAGSGPGACALHPSRLFVYAWHGLEHTLVCYRYDGESVGEPIQRVPLSAGVLAVHPSGRMLYTGQGAWQIDGESGRLSRTGSWSPGGSHLVVSPDGTSVIILDGASGSIDHATADRRTGEVHCKTNVAVVNQPRSIALKTI